MDKFIPLSVPNLKGNELKYVSEAIETEWVSTAGPYVSKFEETVSKYVNAKGAVSCQNGTSGLHMALICAGVQPSEEVIVPTLTFIAAVNPVKYSFAEPVFMDCDDSLTMDPSKLEKFLSEECEFTDGILTNKITNKRIRALIVVHVFGNLADMEKIISIAKKYNLFVIEDATEALGTYYTDGKFKNKFAGTIGNVGVYSFNGNKIITTGGGGMVVSNDDKILDKVRHISTQAKSDQVRFIHDEIGYNYRMTNIQAGLGLAQLEQLDKFIEIKTHNYNKYKKALEGSKYEILDFRKDIRSNYWFYSINIENTGKSTDDYIQIFNENKIQIRPIWGLIGEQIPYLSNESYLIEKAKYYHKNIINIPCSTNLSEEDTDRVIEVLLQNQ